LGKAYTYLRRMALAAKQVKMQEVTSKGGMKFFIPEEDVFSTNVDADCIVYGPTGDKFVRHLVDRSESLTALVIKYDTEEDLVRRYNRTMIFEHLDNLHGEYIYIPVQKNWTIQLVAPVSAPQDDRWKRLMISKFCDHIGKAVKSVEAEYYLDEADWNIEEAGKIWREDEAWEKSAGAAEKRKNQSDSKMPKTQQTETRREPTEESDGLLGPAPPGGANELRRRQLAKRMQSSGTELGVLK